MKRHNEQLAELPWLVQVADLIENLGSASFFSKDAEERLLMVSEDIPQRLGLRSRDDMLGKTVFDLYPREQAERFSLDDKKVLHNGERIVNRGELWIDAYGLPDWVLTTKLPVVQIHEGSSRVVGLVGTTRPAQHRGKFHFSDEVVSQACRILSVQKSNKLDVPALAKTCCVSVRTLQRRFRETLGQSPKSFFAQMRIAHACQLMRTTRKQMGEIALIVGFSEQSSMNRAFRDHLGTSPGNYARRFTSR